MVDRLFEQIREQVEASGSYAIPIGATGHVVVGFLDGQVAVQLTAQTETGTQTLTGKFNPQVAQLLSDLIASFANRGGIVKEHEESRAPRTLN